MMEQNPLISSAGYSNKGPKLDNQDSYGVHVPGGSLARTKGLAAVIADGMSAAEAGKEASHSCVQGFLNDYFSTPESWSAKTSGQKVLGALNSWLYGQGMLLYGTPKGMVTTLSALVIKSTHAYIFHVGDTRIYRLRGKDVEPLTSDHRVYMGGDKNYLSRAMGIELNLEIDYRRFTIEQGDIFIFTTDGVHDFLPQQQLKDIALNGKNDLQATCKTMVNQALANNSNDNLTCQIVRIDELPSQDKQVVYQDLTALPFPPPLEPGMVLDGYRIVRELHASKRTEVYLAVDEQSGDQVILKAPSVNYEDDPDYIDHFLHEEWVGRRLNNPHVLTIKTDDRKRQCLYYVTEYIEGQSLRQWMHDNPNPSLIEVRDIAEQITKGLRAFHRMEMIHQDLKPENIMIDQEGTVKIIDFGSTKIAGIEEISSPIDRESVRGTENYTAPEHLHGIKATNRADIFSLGVIVYEMLTGKLPYKSGGLTNKARAYQSSRNHRQDIPHWLDMALAKSVRFDPGKRYPALSEFIHDISEPNPEFRETSRLPLMERNPVGFWKGFSLLLIILNLVVLYFLSVK